MTTIADGLKDVFLAGVGAMALGAETVSYTHLDVYKRQIYYKENHAKCQTFF